MVILAGAIAKGGKQNRVLGMDLVLKPQSGKVPVTSFCVEQSRWSPRGDNTYTDGLSDGFFRYESSLKDNADVRVRISFESGLKEVFLWRGNLPVAHTASRRLPHLPDHAVKREFAPPSPYAPP